MALMGVGGLLLLAPAPAKVAAGRVVTRGRKGTRRKAESGKDQVGLIDTTLHLPFRLTLSASLAARSSPRQPARHGFACSLKNLTISGRGGLRGTFAPVVEIDHDRLPPFEG